MVKFGLGLVVGFLLGAFGMGIYVAQTLEEEYNS